MEKSLAGKIASAALEVGGKLKADKTNKEQNYGYISADKVLSICGQALFNQGLSIMPEVTSNSTQLFEYTDNYGKTKRRYDATIQMSFIMTDGAQSQICTWFGCGSDYMTPDKALYKAITSGHKYFLMKLFCIGEGNEDSEHQGDEGEMPRQQKQPQQSRQAEILQELGVEGAEIHETENTAGIIKWLIQEGIVSAPDDAKALIEQYKKPIVTGPEKRDFMTWATLKKKGGK